MTIPKINAQASMPISHPLCFEHVISRPKWDGVEEIMVSCILQTSSVWSIPLPPEHQCWCLHIPFPLHQMFYLWSSKDTHENILRNAQSFLLTHPRGVSPVWHWASGRQFTLCDASSFLLTSWVGSSRMVVAHLVCSAHTPEHKVAPITGVMRKSQFWWRTCECLVHWFFHELGSDAFSNSAFHFVWFLLPLVFHLSPPFVGVSFSQDQVNWLQ